MPDVSGASAVNTRDAYSNYPARTRLRVHWAPGIPRALCFQGRDFLASFGRKRAARMRMHVASLRGALATKISNFEFATRWIASLTLARRRYSWARGGHGARCAFASPYEADVIPGRCHRVRAERGPMTGAASNPESRKSGSGPFGPSRNDDLNISRVGRAKIESANKHASFAHLRLLYAPRNSEKPQGVNFIGR
jgi:hypothetical protein